MRVLHVIPSLSPLRGGPVFTMDLIARGLAATGVEVHVAATDDDGAGRRRLPLAQPVREGDFTYWYFPRQTRFYTGSLPLSRWLARSIRSFDLVHTHALFSFPPLAAAAWAARSGVPYILRPLGTLERWGLRNRRPLLKQLSFALFERRALARAAAVHFTSARERDEAAHLGAAGRSVIIPNPVALAEHPGAAGSRLRDRFPVLAGRTIVLFLGRIDPKKGLDLLLRALAEARARRPELALVIAGAGDPALTARLQTLAAELGLADATLWTGFLDGPTKLAALAGADMLALPSFSENFGNAVVEAMAAGLPVIVSDQVGIHHEIAAAAAGVVVPTEVAPLAAALARLAGDPAGRQEMGQRGQHLARTHYTPEAVARQLITLYTSLGETHRPSAAQDLPAIADRSNA